MLWRRRTEGPPAPAACWSCRWPPNHELQDSEPAPRNLDISLIAGMVECDEDVIGEAPLVCAPGMHRCPLLVSLRSRQARFRRARLSQVAYRAPGRNPSQQV
jgi:transposase